MRPATVLSASLLLAPRRRDGFVYFVSDLSGRLSLWRMREAGGLPERLLPADVALMHPELLEGEPYVLLDDHLVVMLDHAGDERYQPCRVPLDGGEPVPVFGDRFAAASTHLEQVRGSRAILRVEWDGRVESDTLLVDLADRTVTPIASLPFGLTCIGADATLSTAWLVRTYLYGDTPLEVWHGGRRTRLWGTAKEERSGPEPYAFFRAAVATHEGVLLVSALFHDRGGLVRIGADGAPAPVPVVGVLHGDEGELDRLVRTADGRLVLGWNVRGVSWLYLAEEHPDEVRIVRVLAGEGALAGGVLGDLHAEGDGVTFRFATATRPAGLHHVAWDGRHTVLAQSRLIGGPAAGLVEPELVRYTSHDGLAIDGRLYRPRGAGPFPVVFYVHGGPQSQDRPDLTWFNVPLIQLLVDAGIAVWAPNVRGSTGYGLAFTRHVDRDWGGRDRLDHLAAHDHLARRPDLDLTRAGVMGRSYGGYMTLLLAGRHPERWRAAVDMFGPADLFTFSASIPAAWRPYLVESVGDPERDRAFFVDRSPVTWLHQLACPLLVVQGANDPRVRRSESDQLVARLRALGKALEYVVYEDEGHDVTRYVNRVDCYGRVVEFFRAHLAPGGGASG